MSISKATGQWDGTLREGRGAMRPAHGPEVPFSLATRFEGERGSNPEEMIGAALAGCFSMALTSALTKAGLAPKSVRAAADVSLDKDGAGFTITGIALTTTADVPGIDPERFQQIAEETKKGCPVSKALAGTTITLTANLA